MTDPYIHPQADQRAFHAALCQLQQQLTPETPHRQALALLSPLGLSWWIDHEGLLHLCHRDGWEVLGGSLWELIGLPSLVVPPDFDCLDSEPDVAEQPRPVVISEPESQAPPVPAVPAATPPVPPTPAAAPPPPAAAPSVPAVPAEATADTEPVDPSHSTEPLSDDDARSARSMIGQLSEAQRKAFKTAFCEAFAISPAPLRVAALITERRHAEFVVRFVDEAEGIARP